MIRPKYTRQLSKLAIAIVASGEWLCSMPHRSQFHHARAGLPQPEYKTKRLTSAVSSGGAPSHDYIVIAKPNPSTLLFP